MFTRGESSSPVAGSEPESGREVKGERGFRGICKILKGRESRGKPSLEIYVQRKEGSDCLA